MAISIDCDHQLDHHCHVTCGERDIKDTLNSKFNWTERWGDNW